MKGIEMSRIIRACALIILFGQWWATTTAQQPQPASTAQQSQAAARTAPVAIGEAAPDFTLKDEEGRAVTLSAARGKMPVVLVFYRGYW